MKKSLLKSLLLASCLSVSPCLFAEETTSPAEAPAPAVEAAVEAVAEEVVEATEEAVAEVEQVAETVEQVVEATEQTVSDTGDQVAVSASGEEIPPVVGTSSWEMPSLSLSMDFTSKNYSRGILWDKNPGFLTSVDVAWEGFFVGINGRAPTRNTRNEVKYSGIEFGARFAGSRTLYTQYNPSDIREANEFDELQFKLGYSYTFEDVPFVGNVSVTGAWTYFRENNIYSEGYASRVDDDLEELFSKSFYTIGKNYKTVYDEIENASQEGFNKVLKMVDYLQTEFDRISRVTGDAYYKLYAKMLQNVSNDFYKRWEDIDWKAQDAADKAGAIIGSFIDGVDAWIKEFNKNEVPSFYNSIKMAQDLDRYYDIVTHLKVHYRNKRRQEFSLGISFDDLWFSPNASINYNPNGHFWGQIGLRHSLPLTFVSEKLFWNNSLDIYWFDHDFFSGYVQIGATVRLKKEPILAYGRRNYSITELNSLLGNQNWRFDAHSRSGFKDIVWKSSLDYMLTDNICISPNLTVIKYIDHITDRPGMLYNNEDWVVMAGISLTLRF